MLFLVALICAVFPAVFGAKYGADVSSLVSKAGWDCLKKDHAVTFISMRAWQQTGHFDPNAAATVEHAHEAGMEVDVYFYPSNKHDSANASVAAFHKGVVDHKMKFGTVWLDIEDAAGWGKCDSNVKYIDELYKALKAHGYKVAVYTSFSQWQPICCAWKGLSHLPLWYAHYDNEANFNDFKPFGGWTHPTIKQFRGSHTECGVNLDANYRLG